MPGGLLTDLYELNMAVSYLRRVLVLGPLFGEAPRPWAQSLPLGDLEAMVLGSVAQALLHHAPCPVGIVHPD